jgi:hypothetical protein
MNIGPGNIEALLLDALEGRLSAADAELVWAALEAHPEWGVSWDFEDRELPRLQAEDVPAMDWSGLKKEVVTDEQIRQALRQDRDRHSLDASVMQSLYRREERVLWRYWAAAASVAVLVWIAWPTSERGNVPSIAGNVTVSTDTSSIIPPTPIAPIQQLAADHPSTALGNHPSTALGNHPSAALVNPPSTALGDLPTAALSDHPSKTREERIIIEHCHGTPEQIQEEVLPKILPLSEEDWNVAQGNDTTSLEAPLELPFELQPTQSIALVEDAPRLRSGTTPELRSETEAGLRSGTETRTYTPREWLKMKANQIAARKEADGTLPTVRRDKQSFNLQWGSLSINAH